MSKEIGLISDTHSYWADDIEKYLLQVDEIWHAGDIGSMRVIENLEKLGKTIRAVYGNIDNSTIRSEFPRDQKFEIEKLKIWMTHIGGYPPSYSPLLRKKLDEIQPDIFICGHSHILKVIPDRKRNLIHMNPGACGVHGFHKFRTLLTFRLSEGEIQNLNAVELGKRGKIEKN